MLTITRGGYFSRHTMYMYVLIGQLNIQYLELNLMLSLNCILVYIDLTVTKHIYIGTGTY
jgi:hypothetical protein